MQRFSMVRTLEFLDARFQVLGSVLQVSRSPGGLRTDGAEFESVYPENELDKGKTKERLSTE